MLVRHRIIGGAERGCTWRKPCIAEYAIICTPIEPSEIDWRVKVQMLNVLQMVGCPWVSVVEKEGIDIENIQCPLTSGTERNGLINQRNQRCMQSGRDLTQNPQAGSRQLRGISTLSRTCGQ